MQRATGTTKMNELSSRSHAVFIIIIEKSTVTSRQEADGDEMEQFRGLAPGVSLSTGTIGMHSVCEVEGKQVFRLQDRDAQDACRMLGMRHHAWCAT